MPRQKSTHIDDPAAVGARLRAAREQVGLSQRQLSFLGCSPAYISRIEAGERIPSLQLLRELGRRLGVSEDYLATGTDTPARTTPLLLEAEIALRLDELERAEELFASVLEGATGPYETAAAKEGLGHLALRRGKPRDAISLFEQALMTSNQDESERPALAEGLGRAYAMLGEFAPAIAIFERCCTIFAERSDTVQTVRFSCLLGYALMDNGNLDRAEEAIGRALAEGSKVIHDPITRARLYWAQSKLRMDQGDSEAAVRYAYQTLATLQLTEDLHYQAIAHQLVAHLENDRRRPEEALRHLEQGWPLIERSGTPLELAHFRIEEARALARLGREEEAAALAMSITGQLGDALPEDSGRAYTVLADVFVELGHSERAQELYELAAEFHRQNNPNRYLVEIYSKLAELCELNGHKNEAYEYMKKALGMQQAVTLKFATGAARR